MAAVGSWFRAEKMAEAPVMQWPEGMRPDVNVTSYPPQINDRDPPNYPGLSFLGSPLWCGWCRASQDSMETSQGTRSAWIISDLWSQASNLPRSQVAKKPNH